MTPTLINTPVLIAGISALDTLVTASLTVSNGDVMVVKTGSEDRTGVVASTPTASGQTFTSKASDVTPSKCHAQVWACIVTGSPGSITISVAFTGTGGDHCMVVEQWRGAQLAGTPAVSSPSVGNSIGPSATITTVAANSIVTWVDGDWAALAPGTPSYRSSATQEAIRDKSPSLWVGYWAYQTAASAGSQTIGLTTPASAQNWKMVGIEVQDASGAVAYPFGLTTSTPRYR